MITEKCQDKLADVEIHDFEWFKLVLTAVKGGQSHSIRLESDNYNNGRSILLEYVEDSAFKEDQIENIASEINDFKQVVYNVKHTAYFWESTL